MGLGVDWDIDLLQQLFEDRGDLVELSTGMLCPSCEGVDHYASGIDLNGRPAYVNTFYCPTCQGDGHIYRNARQIYGLVTSVNPGNRDLLPDGYVSPGDAIFSPDLRAGYVSDFDKITFCNTATADCSQVIMRGAATLADNKELKTDLAENEDRLNYLGACAVWCEDANGIVYQEGADYTFNGRKIVWINSPNAGTMYTIKYRAHLEWIVYASPMERFDKGRSLGQKVILRKKHTHNENRPKPQGG